MNVTILTSFLAPCLPFLLKKVGESALSGAATKLGQDTWDKATAIWAKLWPSIEAEAAANIAATQLADKPESEAWKAALQEELETLLQKDKALAEFIAEIFKDKNEVSTNGVQIQQTAGTVEGQMIGQMQNSEAKNIGNIGSVQGDVTL
ncbi:hypothetical protein [Anabaena subtropica]|uniref:Uncharacterized protein n=1 Tax=Anabaena subtropica FACHB-260 TaxID=2692884 RepID=A0ABR8CTA2_9NOST|nr:hypothetical protein [Anabaena subtropica]MBD2346204.1 hypothetical protein [Anabaena subtropica FACHB-260]